MAKLPPSPSFSLPLSYSLSLSLPPSSLPPSLPLPPSFAGLSDILGERADIHTGGVDLKFPHHDNEIAQAEVMWRGVCEGGECGE